MTHWVREAWTRLHEEYKDIIIKTFRQVGLTLNPDGSEDIKLKIKDLLRITIGDFKRPIVVPNNVDISKLVSDVIEVLGNGEQPLYTT